MKKLQPSAPGRARAADPARLDVRQFAGDAARLSGELPLTGLQRLQASLWRADDGGPGGDPAAWSAEGGEARVAGSGPVPWLHLRAQAEVLMECQRCLQPMRVPVHVDRRFRFVASEAEAEAQDLDSEDEVLALPAALDLPALVEDELILALPLVPRHERCEPPAPLADEAPDERPERPHPFAALEALKRGRQGGH
ncbi:DUF177 domain-containing protein [Aquabacterium sp. J223]|uniref:YceD family protein n=1 Tax=Aquabacterium sp. J223 TaxID=2898431 RepID=UPI0021AE29EA|nr:DUF177 domain-containing protein [Aquabacterium sp. J223]UUX96785.1 DUF177 domain-containing protein [Aquabacterium sp. J223]